MLSLVWGLHSCPRYSLPLIRNHSVEKNNVFFSVLFKPFLVSLSLYRHVLRVRVATPGWRMLCWQSASTSSASSALRRATTHARGSAPNATRPSGPTTSIASTSAKSHAAKLVRKRVSEMSWSRDTAWGKGSARHSRAPSSNYVLPLHSDVQEIVGEETVDDFSFVWAAVMLWRFLLLLLFYFNNNRSFSHPVSTN